LPPAEVPPPTILCRLRSEKAYCGSGGRGFESRHLQERLGCEMQAGTLLEVCRHLVRYADARAVSHRSNCAHAGLVAEERSPPTLS
jgi:hypothetical protein